MASILLIEDAIGYEDVVDYPLVRALRRRGYTVEVAMTGDEAMNKLEQHKFDGVILDIMMPHGDGEAINHATPRMSVGKEVLRQLRRNERPSGTAKDVPVVVVSAVIDFVDVKDIVAMLGENGARWFLSKPVKPSVIIGVLAEALRR